MPKSTRISSLSASANCSSLGGGGGIGRGFGFVSTGAPNVCGQFGHFFAPRRIVSLHPGHVFVCGAPRLGGATVTGSVAFARLLGGSPPVFLRGGMLPDLF